MSEATQVPAPPEPPPALPAPTAAPETGHGSTAGAIAFARRHPALTVIGTAGAAMLGGLELVAGVVIGAGVASLLRAPGERAAVTGAPGAGDDARTVVRRLAPEVKKRARAVVQAARGKLSPVTP